MLVVTVVAQLALLPTTHGGECTPSAETQKPHRLGAAHHLAIKWRPALSPLLLAGLGGILLASRIGSSQVNAGAGYLMDAVAAGVDWLFSGDPAKPNALGTLVGR